MEQTKAYKNVEEMINHVQAKISLCGSITQACEESGKIASKEIDEYFAKCMNSLAARKAVLLKEVEQKVAEQKQCVETARGKLEASAKAYQHALETVTMLYPFNATTAENMCKDLKSVPIPDVAEVKVAVDLPIALYNSTQRHGKVLVLSRLLDSLTATEMVVTVAGSIKGCTDGNGLNAQFNYPWGMCFNPHDKCAYVCDYSNSMIRKINNQGDVTTFAKELNGPTAIMMNNDKSFFVANYGGNTISKISPSGEMSIFAGSGQSGSQDGNGKASSFYNPAGIAMDQAGNIYVSDYSSHIIRKITSQGEVSTFAGSSAGHADGNGKAAKFNYPYGICFDQSNKSLLVCDYTNSKLRRIQLNGDVSTVCDVQSPTSVLIRDKTIMVSSDSHKIFAISAKDGKSEAVALMGSGRAERVDGKFNVAGFCYPRGMVLDESTQTCYVSDYNSHTIRKISLVNSFMQ